MPRPTRKMKTLTAHRPVSCVSVAARNRPVDISTAATTRMIFHRP
jgi:hypothetical protein